MKDKFDKLEETLDRDIAKTDITYETTAIDDVEIEYVDEPELIIGKPTFWDKTKHSLVSGTTFDFLRHFLIGFVGIGGTTLATTKNLTFALIGGVLGGVVEGGRKVWSSNTAAKNGGTKNRILEAVMQLIVYLIDYWLERRKEEKK